MARHGLKPLTFDKELVLVDAKGRAVCWRCGNLLEKVQFKDGRGYLGMGYFCTLGCAHLWALIEAKARQIALRRKLARKAGKGRVR